MPGDRDSGPAEGDIRVSEISTAEIIARLQKYEIRVEKLRDALARATARRDALKAVLAEFKAVQHAKPSPPPIPPGDVEAIQGKPLRYALIIMAERHGGMLESGRARRTLEAAGIGPVPMPPGLLWKQIAVTRRFKKAGRGAYKLLPAEPTTGSLLDD